MSIVCGCNRGYASEVDKLCRRCRALQYSRSAGKSVGVRHDGEGMSLEQEERLLAKKGRVPSWKLSPGATK